MGMRIHQLAPAIANQIAAGEVIERPASVVKELLENAVDAGADAIIVEIGYGGLNQIKISDNGVGIVAEDLPLAITAHATSKISKLDDLYAIDSMGFRGEALASIASIAKVTISSRPAEQEHAMMLRAEGSKTTLSLCARNVGTTIDVLDLFFNAPVRKRFLKNEKLEFQAIEMVVKRFALSVPEIALILKHNNKLVLSLPPALNEQAKFKRVSKIFGISFIKDAIFLDAACGAMRLSGWISGPNFQRSQNDRQWVYINRRMVKDKLINHALKQGYDELLHPGRFPACLLYFTVNSSEVDVNVHPTKHEVRFQQPRLVHDFFSSQVMEALQSVALKNDGKTDTQDRKDLFRNACAGDALERDHMICEPSPGLIPRENRQKEVRKLLLTQTNNADDYPDFEMPWIILNDRYIVLFVNHQPYLVDAVSIYQQWIQKQLVQAALPLTSRPLLVPIHYSFSQKTEHQMGELQHSLGQLGICIEAHKADFMLIRSVPIALPYLDLRLFFDKVMSLEFFHLEHLVEIISQTHIFDLKLLTLEERRELTQWVLEERHQQINQPKVYKPITVDDCRMLLDV